MNEIKKILDTKKLG